MPLDKYQPSANPAPMAFALMAYGRALEENMERAAGTPSMSVAQARFIRHLVAEPRGLAAAELATRASTTRANVSQMLNRLEAAGMITREPHPDDARGVNVRLTPAAIDAYRDVEQAVIDFEARLVAQLADDAPAAERISAREACT